LSDLSVIVCDALALSRTKWRGHANEQHDREWRDSEKDQLGEFPRREIFPITLKN
jgi:hypothetical protein